jgi:hypothetical protein
MSSGINTLNLGAPIGDTSPREITTRQEGETQEGAAGLDGQGINLAAHTETESTYHHPTPLPNALQSAAATEGATDNKAESDSGASSATLNGQSGSPLKKPGQLSMPTNERRDSDTEGRDTLGTLPPSPSAIKRSPLAATDSATSTNQKSRKVERTASGTFIRRGRSATGGTTNSQITLGPDGNPLTKEEGGESVSGYGMVAVSRQTSQPPGVGPFGGVASAGEDAELGLRAVRSWQEELERQEKREKQGPDPWAVRFEQGDPENPKVS